VEHRADGEADRLVPAPVNPQLNPCPFFGGAYDQPGEGRTACLGARVKPVPLVGGDDRIDGLWEIELRRQP
jgi:hypothetical protein